jgi:hypothetical protein
VRYWKLGGLLVSLAVAVAACGGPGGPAGPGPGDADDFPTSARITDEDERQVHPLAPGRYRLQWTATDCRPSLVITDAAFDEVVYENLRPSVRIVFVPRLDGGEYYIDQVNDECEEWTIELARF